MDNKTVFVVTLKGIGEIKNHTRLLPENIKRVLVLVDDESSVETLAVRAAPNMRSGLREVLQTLENGGFIQDKAAPKTNNMLRMATPKNRVSSNPHSQQGDDLDFTFDENSSAHKTSSHELSKSETEILKNSQESINLKDQIASIRTKAETAVRVHAETLSKAKQAAEITRKNTEQDAARILAEKTEAIRVQAELEAAKIRAELEAARQEADLARANLETARVEAENLAKREAEASHLREEEAAARAHAEAEAGAKREAEMVRLKAAEESSKIREEAEAMRSKAEQEAATARAELEAARLEAEHARAELEAAKGKAEILARQEAEAVRQREEEAAAKARAEAELRAKQEVETARLKAEQVAAQVRAEAEALRIKAEQEASKARDELAAAKLEAEQARAALEAARIEAESLAKKEAEAAKLREEEATAKAIAEAKAQHEVELIRFKAEQEAIRVQAEAEALRIKEEQEAVRLEAERVRAEMEAALAKAQAEAEARAKHEAELARLKAEQESTRIRAEAEALRIKEQQEMARVEVEQARAKQEAVRVEAEAFEKRESEAARLREEEATAQAHAEAEIGLIVAQIKAEQEAAKIKAEAEARDRLEAEEARRKAEEEAAKARAEAEAIRQAAELEAAKIKAELEAVKAKAEAESRARAEAEARAKAEEIAKKEAEAARQRAEYEAARAREEAEIKLKLEAKIAEDDTEVESSEISAEVKSITESTSTQKSRAEPPATRSMIATVLFFDIVGYTKQSVSKQIELKSQFNKLVSEFIKDVEENQRIILDTGDGAAIGFLQHPEDAIEVALKFRQAMTADLHRNLPELMVRTGIHLGPVNVVKDMNGQSNMVGDGINDAQRIMSFADFGHIYISRSYFDVVSRLSAEYAKLFQYRGVKNDKHGRQHQVYEAIVDESKGDVQLQYTQNSANKGQSEGRSGLSSSSIKLEPFVLNVSEHSANPEAQQVAAVTQKNLDDEKNIVKEKSVETQDATVELNQTQPVTQVNILPEEVKQKSKQETEAEQKELAVENAMQAAKEARAKAEQEAAKAKAEKEERLMAEEQAKVWAEAEQRAKALAASQPKVEQVTQVAAVSQQTKVASPNSGNRRKPFPMVKAASGIIIFLLLLLAALPYVWPMQSYVPELEAKLSALLQQPVHITRLKMALLPLPKLELQTVSAGNGQELKASSVVMNFDITSLFSEIITIDTLEISDLTLNAESLGKTIAKLQTAGSDPNYPVVHLELKHAQIVGDGITLSPINAKADLGAQGRFGKALVKSEDNKLEIEFQPLQSRWQISLRMKDSSLPWLAGIHFNDLEAKGDAGEGSIDLTEIEGHLFGGKLTGTAHLNWKKGWQMQGRVSMKAIELNQAFPKYGIEGEMGADGSYLLSGSTLSQLAITPHLEGSFAVKKGVISKIDILETAANHRTVVGGRTHFDELSGTLQLENNNQHWRQLNISAGVMNANGTADVSSGGQLSGRLSVEVTMRPGGLPLILSGTLAEPALRPLN